MKEMDEAHARDMAIDSKLTDLRRLLNDVAEAYSGQRFGTACKVLADEVWKQRQRIVRRWD